MIKSIFKKPLRLILVILFISGIVYMFQNYQFHQTYAIGGEVGGYIGKKASIFKSEENLDEILIKLSEEFDGADVEILDVNLANDRFSVIIQDPNEPTYYDRYEYNSTSFFPSKWRKGDPYKLKANDNQTFPLSEFTAERLYGFYSEVQLYKEEHQIEVDEYYVPRITINFTDEKQLPTLFSYISGVRQDYAFSDNLDGGDFTAEK